MAPNLGETFFLVKRIKYHGKRVPIILQNINGPCPLLSLANVLLLRDQMRLHPDVGEVQEQQLISLLAEVLLENGSGDKEGLPTDFAVNLQQNLADALELLPKLATGIDVNMRFDAIKGFEFTNEIAIFDLLEVALVHGWLYDPQDMLAASSIGSLSYNQLMNVLVEAQAHSAPDTDRQKLSRVLSTSAASRPSGSSPPPPSLPPTAPAATGGVQGEGEEDEQLRRALEMSLRPAHEEQGDEGAGPSSSQSVPPPVPSPPSDAQIVSDLVKGIFARIAQHEKHEGQDPTPKAENLAPGSGPSAAPSSSSSPPYSTERVAAIMEFLEGSSSQLTAHGLFELHAGLKEGEEAVLFRNNHFSVITKHRGHLYALATDQGYHGQAVVWERLGAVDGDTLMVDEDFVPVRHPGAEVNLLQLPPDVPTPPPTTAATAAAAVGPAVAQLGGAQGAAAVGGGAHSTSEDADLALALQLQEEEEAAYARARQQAQAQQLQAQQQAQARAGTGGQAGGQAQAQARPVSGRNPLFGRSLPSQQQQQQAQMAARPPPSTVTEAARRKKEEKKECAIM